MLLTRPNFLLALCFGLFSTKVLAKWGDEWDLTPDDAGMQPSQEEPALDAYEIWRQTSYRPPTQDDMIAEVEKVADPRILKQHFGVAEEEYARDDCPSVQHRASLRGLISVLESLERKYSTDRDVVRFIKGIITRFQVELHQHEETMMLVCPRRLLKSMASGKMHARKIKKKLRELKAKLAEVSDDDNWGIEYNKAQDIRRWITRFFEIYKDEGGRAAAHMVKKGTRQRKTIRGKR